MIYYLDRIFSGRDPGYKTKTVLRPKRKKKCLPQYRIIHFI